MIVVGTHIDGMTPEDVMAARRGLQEVKRNWKTAFPRTKVTSTLVSCTEGMGLEELSDMLIDVRIFD